MSSTRHNYRSSGRYSGRRRRRRRWLRLLAPVVVGLLLLTLVGVGFAGSSDRIAAGVHVTGMNVGGLTLAETRRKLEQASEKLAWVPVDFRAAGKHFKIAPAQLGVRVDWETALAAARRDGDGLGPLRGFKRLEVRFFGADVVPPISHSQPALKRFLTQVARVVDKPAREPALVLSGSQPSIVPGHRGQVLDRAAAGRLIVRALGSFSRETVILPVAVMAPKVRRADLIRVMGQIRTVVSAPVLLRLGVARWQISPTQIEKMLVYPHDGQRSLSIATDKTNSYLSLLSKGIDKPAKDATFAIAGPSIHVVPSRTGRELDRKRTAGAILSAALDPNNRVAALVMKTTAPKRTTEQAKAMGITGLVGSYETSFTGIANRIHNVQLVAKLIDNKYIAPGAVFSFNQTTGERNAGKGFLTAPVIINGEVSEGLGGGVCQVSTTVFNAAYESGLKIIARTNHALYISHYPLGRDATVNWPSPDLKFLNDTGHWLLMRTFSSSDTLLVALYGTPQHRKVVSETAPLRIDGPPPLKKIPDPNLAVGKTVVKDFGESSSSTSVRRRVYTAQGKLLYDDVFYSNYRALPKIVEVGTKKPAKQKGTTSTGTDTTQTNTTQTDTTSGGTGGFTTPIPPGEPTTTT